MQGCVLDPTLAMEYKAKGVEAFRKAQYWEAIQHMTGV